MTSEILLTQSEIFAKANVNGTEYCDLYIPTHYNYKRKCKHFQGKSKLTVKFVYFSRVLWYPR